MEMNFKRIHPDFHLPEYKTEGAAAFDLKLMDSVTLVKDAKVQVGLGFAAEVPEGYMAILAPRSGEGSNNCVELTNTVGLIDTDYRGQWLATLALKDSSPSDSISYGAGDRLIQCAIVPIIRVKPIMVKELSSTVRGEGGLGSTDDDYLFNVNGVDIDTSRFTSNEVSKEYILAILACKADSPITVTFKQGSESGLMGELTKLRLSNKYVTYVTATRTDNA